MTLRMMRRVGFSSGHRYWLASKSPDENRALFGPWASPYNHGHNYVLDVTTEGAIDPATGMIVNIKVVDEVLKERIVRVFDQKSINDEVPSFADRSPSLENLLFDLRARLGSGALPPEAALVGLRVEETPLLSAEWNIAMPDHVSLTRVYEFAASHRLHSDALSHEENLRLYGKCNNPMGHGHNYVLEVTVSGIPDPVTGMIADLGSLDALVHREVVDRYDHKNLNEDIPEFAGRCTTSEIVATEIFARLRPHLPLVRIRLHETARNVFEVTA
ncbi:MAG TPA: 6-carboxytetrahydropterin synthase [Fimbriimonadaceae bacterium]|nr:6-carboxytetrahydropterin synthase [Fimbriimonadaceae bacterium]